jgi:Fe-S-cluster containining protein
MKIITDIDRIRQLSKQNEDKNWEFRSFLKMVDLDMDEVDAIVHRLYKEVSEQIDCAACRNCCRELLPTLSQDDVARIAAELGTTEAALISEHLEPAEEPEKFACRTAPCPFLGEDGCTLVDSRPEDCRTYPHIQKGEFLTRLISVIENCSVCPIVFNVYERLKAEQWPQAVDLEDLWLDDDYA